MDSNEELALLIELGMASGEDALTAFMDEQSYTYNFNYDAEQTLEFAENNSLSLDELDEDEAGYREGYISVEFDIEGAKALLRDRDAEQERERNKSRAPAKKKAVRPLTFIPIP